MKIKYAKPLKYTHIKTTVKEYNSEKKKWETRRRTFKVTQSIYNRFLDGEEFEIISSSGYLLLVD